MKHKPKKTSKDHSGNNLLEHHSADTTISITPTHEILDLTRRLLELEERYDTEKKKLSEIYDQKEKMELSLYERMKDVGIDQFRTAEFGLISLANRLYGKITDMSVAEEWLKENGLFDEVLRLKPIAARINELLKKRIEAGQSIPPGFDYSLTRTINHQAK